MRPKLLIITNRFVIGGPAFHVADLTCRLQSDFDIRIIGGEAAKGEETNLKIFSGLEIEPILLSGFSRKFNFYNDLISYFKIKRFIKEFRPDIVHTHTFKPGILGRLAAYNLGVTIIIHSYHGHLFYGYFNVFLSKFVVLIERFLAKKSSIIIALSPQQQNDFVNVYQIAQADKVKIVHPGIDVKRFISKPNSRQKFRDDYKISSDYFVLGIVGRLVKIKNIEQFIRGIKYLKQNNIKVRGVIVGDGPEKRNLKDYILSLGLSFAEYSVGNQNEDIVFTSWSKEMAKIYSGLDGIVLTSLNEGTPYSLIEAQLMGIPVISAKIGGVEDIVINEKTALLHNTEQEFFSNLLRWSSDAQLRKYLSDNALDWSKAHFSADTMALELKNLYKDLISSHIKV
jgi:glycosyltransferase involved in cell wall biosynthesis